MRAQRAELGLIQRAQIVPIHDDAAGGGLDQLQDGAPQR
jgi:hypothetical protein